MEADVDRRRSGALVRSRAEQVAPRFALVMLLVSVTGFLAVQLINVVELRREAAETAVCIGVIVASFALQLLHSAQLVRVERPAWGWVTLPLLLVITAVPIVAYDRLFWGGSCGFLIASVLLLVRPQPLSWALGLLVLVGVAVVSDSPLEGIVYLLGADLLYGVSIYTLTRLTDLVSEVSNARRDLARMAVEQERLRFSRDLHDLLGYSLTAITLKGELALRLADRDPEQAQQNLDTVLGVSRQALTDLRSVARSYKELSLDMQVLSARSVLESAGIEVAVDRACAADVQLPAQVDTVLATVVREGVTNVLRHSGATRTHIEIVADRETATVRVRNDGVPTGSAGCLPRLGDVAASDGTPLGDGQGGLGNLHSRVTRVGGRLRVGVADDGWFELQATAPCLRTATSGAAAS